MDVLNLAKDFILANKKKIIFISIILFLIILSVSTYFLFYKSREVSEPVNKISIVEKEIIEEETESEEVATVFVDIKGEVISPGVYEVESNLRVIDVINLAGGLTKKANTRYINLSKKLFDTMVIVIYSETEIKELLTKEAIPKICEDTINDACITTNNSNSNSNNSSNNNSNNNSSKQININTATLEELMTLSGIGESKAKAIISYREENGSFESIEDIMNVSGIGTSTYDQIKENITVK